MGTARVAVPGVAAVACIGAALASSSALGMGFAAAAALGMATFAVLEGARQRRKPQANSS
jgi:hypothetical protein